MRSAGVWRLRLFVHADDRLLNGSRLITAKAHAQLFQQLVDVRWQAHCLGDQLLLWPFFGRRPFFGGLLTDIGP